MPETATPTEAPVPRHVRWFAPWTWKRWKLFTLLALIAAVGYVESAPAMHVLLNVTGLIGHPVVSEFFLTVYYPLLQLCQDHKAVGWFFNIQVAWMGYQFYIYP